MGMLVYSTTTGQKPVDPQGFATPEPLPALDEHAGCVHSIGFCDAEWD